MNQRVAFRLDASVEVGAGHVARCLSLARELLARGVGVEFLTRGLPDYWRQRAEGQGIVVRVLSLAGECDATADADASVAALGDARVDWVVLDHYGLGRDWEHRLRAKADRVAAIDDLANREHDVDLLVDPNHGRRSSDYDSLLPAHCVRLVSARYALLRPEFLDAHAGALRSRERGVDRLFVCFGGADPHGLASRVVEDLLGQPGFEAMGFLVALGSADPQGGRLRLLSGQHPGRIELAIDADDLAVLMAGCSMAIGAGGGMCWERACVGLPSACIVVAENQAPAAAALADEGVHLLLGDAVAVAPDAWRSALMAMRNLPGMADRMARRATELVDGRGCQRVVQRLLQAPIELSPLAEADIELSFRWRNDARTRRHVFDPRELDFDEHAAWTRQSFAMPSRDLFMCRRAGERVAVLRLDSSPDGTVVFSIYVDPERGGSGIGAEAIRAGVDWLRRHRPSAKLAIAHILEANVASERAFATAGFDRHFRTMHLRLDG